MKKTLTSLSALSILAVASPAFAHHGDNTSLLSNIAHWLSSPVHGLLTVAAIGVFGLVAYKITRKKTQA
ncbi:MAG: hypothetical protein ABJG88_08355 [Litorimonas sp.]